MTEIIHDFPDSQGVPADPATTSAALARLLNERDRLIERCVRLEVALRDAIRKTTRVRRRTIEVDPAGNVYDVDWTDQVREWANLCGLDLGSMSQDSYLGSP